MIWVHRPKSQLTTRGLLRKTAHWFPDRQSDGDGDKHLRSICDGLENAGVIANDGQIIDKRVVKVFTDDEDEQGCEVTLWSWDGETPYGPF